MKTSEVPPKWADLHIHSYYSDGSDAPEQIIEQAHKNGISCLALTDHDTIEGIAPMRLAAQKYNVEIISGVELSARQNSREIHILGYAFDLENRVLIEEVKGMQASRLKRMKLMIERLHKLGFHQIQLEDVRALTRSKSLGRPHLAQALVQKGIVSSVEMAFEKYLAEGAKAYVPQEHMTPLQAIALIKHAGGVAVLAHPHITQRDELIPSLVHGGLGGLEVYYPSHSDKIVKYYEKIARKHHLLMTGGSDAHGEAKKYTFVGKVRLAYDYVEKLKLAAAK